ncbi:hypothetical protein IAU60_003321 [Kwoniella sp. DSM 27419]
MSATASGVPNVALDLVNTEEDKRAQRLASARKKLETNRASRGSDQFDSSPSGTSSSSSRLTPSHHPVPYANKAMPLTTESNMNLQFSFPSDHQRTVSKGKDRDFQVPSKPPASEHRHKRSESQSHRRQRSSVSVSLNRPCHVLAEPSIMSAPPKEIITTPATPLLLDSPEISVSSRIEPDEDHEQVASRLSTFTFGARPPAGTFPPKRRQQQPLLPSQALFALEKGSPSVSPLASPTSGRVSAASSRPPSLLLTRASPMPFGSPTSTAPSRTSLATSPSSPPTPSRRKRHSHTRSNSISLPNLKLGVSRPTSLGIPTSPSYPASPVSPASVTDSSSRLLNGQRLRFEPSGRGAEAEKEKEESRRKALNKLTGGASQTVTMDLPVAEISLPELDDEDTSSVASSNRTLSGVSMPTPATTAFNQASSFTFPVLGSSAAATLTSSPFSWSATNDDCSPVERWSGNNFGASKEVRKDDGPAYGMDLSAVMAKRPSINRQLSALAEVDESEEDEMEFEEEEDPVGGTGGTIADHPESAALLVGPTPSRLRELRLPSSVSSSSTPRQYESFGETVHSSSLSRQASSSPTSISPTKGYGSIGRGRPNLSNVSGLSSTPTSVSTPRSAGLGNRRRALGSGSRGSSISYRKDDSSSSSRDMGASLALVGSPTVVSPTNSMSASAPSPAHRGWDAAPRGTQRPCPRPKQLVGLGIGSSGSGRVLGEVDEETEGSHSSPASDPARDLRWASPTPGSSDIPRQFAGFGPGPTSEDGGRPSTELSRDSFADESQWRDVQLEMEMEREALKEDVEHWKGRCQTLEDKLEAERKESIVLRDRVRKLGDRLSSVSSVPSTRAVSSNQAEESRLMAEMRAQLFALTASLESEQRAKTEALARVAELEALQKYSFDRASDGESESDQLLLTARPDNNVSDFPFCTPSPMIAQSPSAVPNSAMITPSEEASPSLQPDPNLTRMRGWGFPKESSPIKMGKAKKRESFFGLSNALQRTSSTESAEGHLGVDLPPFVLSEAPTSPPAHGFNAPISFASEPTFRAVSDPVPAAVQVSLDRPAPPRSNSSSTLEPIGSGVASAAMSFLSGYLPTANSQASVTSSDAGMEARSPPKARTLKAKFAGMSKTRFISKEEQKVPEASHVGLMDFRSGCQCCTGPIIEV